MQGQKKKPVGLGSTSQIRRRFGRGFAGYYAAKYAWFDENPRATQAQIDKAMRFIAQATGV